MDLEHNGPRPGGNLPWADRRVGGGHSAAQTGTAARPPAAVPAFVHRSPQGVEFEVTAEGLSAIRASGRELASGGWSLFNAEPWFKDAGSGTVRTGPIQEKSWGARPATRPALSRPAARPHHDRLPFEGEDVTISARVENHIPTSRSTWRASPG